MFDFSLVSCVMCLWFSLALCCRTWVHVFLYECYTFWKLNNNTLIIILLQQCLIYLSNWSFYYLFIYLYLRETQQGQFKSNLSHRPSILWELIENVFVMNQELLFSAKSLFLIRIPLRNVLNWTLISFFLSSLLRFFPPVPFGPSNSEQARELNPIICCVLITRPPSQTRLLPPRLRCPEMSWDVQTERLPLRINPPSAASTQPPNNSSNSGKSGHF